MQCHATTKNKIERHATTAFLLVSIGTIIATGCAHGGPHENRVVFIEPSLAERFGIPKYIERVEDVHWPGPPNLTITKLAPARVGDKINVTATVQMVFGEINTQVELTALVFVFYDQMPFYRVELPQTKSLNPFVTLDVVFETKNLSFMEDQLEVSIAVQIDPNNQVAESIEGDNQRSWMGTYNRPTDTWDEDT